MNVTTSSSFLVILLIIMFTQGSLKMFEPGYGRESQVFSLRMKAAVGQNVSVRPHKMVLPFQFVD